MRKSNFMTLLLLFSCSVAAALFSAYTRHPTTTQAGNLNSSLTADAVTQVDLPTPPTAPEVSVSDETPPEPVVLSDALFIGDSRTVGLMEYAGIDEADFFCLSGLNVLQVQKERITVPNIGKVTLSELLSNKKYGKIYIMLGINELGYRLSHILEKYQELLQFIEQIQPDAVIFIQANLHVSKKRSDTDKIINNPAINTLNTELAKLADQKKKFYLDVNSLFDDSNGNLSFDKTQDGAHLYAKYYLEWGKWIRQESGKYRKE